MNKLDSREEIALIDKQNVLGSVEALADQCLHAFEEAGKVEIPDSYKNVKNVLMAGMGGSGLGARVIESVYANHLKVPFTRINDYELPDYVNSESLVICSAYSGTTEEPVSIARQTIERGAKLIAIGSGNTLIDIAEESGAPFYKIDPKFNPSNEPRMAIGYSVVGQLVMAARTGLFDLSIENVKDAADEMRSVIETIKVEIPESENPAKLLARRLYGKNVFYFSSSHLVGAMHTVSNQLNENAKVFSGDYVIPELNHHLMEGLKHPISNPEHLFIFFANSDKYSPRIAQRHEITKEVVKENKIEHFEYKAKAKSDLSQAFELIQFGAYVNLYLSILYEQNPAPIPWVDYFKEKLGQPLGK